MVSQPSAAKEASIVIIAETLLASVIVTRCCSDDEDSEAAIANAAWSIVTAFPRELAGPVEDSVIAALVARGRGRCIVFWWKGCKVGRGCWLLLVLVLVWDAIRTCLGMPSGVP